MKFHKLLMTGCRDMDKKHQKCPKNGVFQKSGSVTFASLGYPSCKKLGKTNEQSLRYLKDRPQTNGRTDGPTDKGDY